VHPAANSNAQNAVSALTADVATSLLTSCGTHASSLAETPQWEVSMNTIIVGCLRGGRAAHVRLRGNGAGQACEGRCCKCGGPSDMEQWVARAAGTDGAKRVCQRVLRQSRSDGEHQRQRWPAQRGIRRCQHAGVVRRVLPAACRGVSTTLHATCNYIQIGRRTGANRLQHRSG
jgi:hypothetical protein